MLSGCTKNTEETTDIIKSDEWSSCYQAYKSVLADWTLIEKYGDFSYYAFYFGDNYGYDSYFLFDVDKNGIPELFLCSESMCITTVFTYAQKLCWLVSDNIDGIEEGEAVCGAIWERINTDPYETLAFGGRDASQYHEIENYEEEIEYTSDGKIVHYKSQGNITYLEDAENTDTIVEIDFLYRNDGSLKERKYRHNGLVFETTCSVMDSFYDRQQRLLYEDCYITHGSLDYYYIYNGEEQIPTYCLILDHNLDLLCPELLIMQSYFGT